MTDKERKRVAIEAKIELIDHLITALCTCELTSQGRVYLCKMKEKLLENDLSST